MPGSSSALTAHLHLEAPPLLGLIWYRRWIHRAQSGSYYTLESNRIPGKPALTVSGSSSALTANFLKNSRASILCALS